MKKKILLFIFSLCILLPSAFMLTACSRMKVEFDLPERGVVLSPMDSDNNAKTWAVYDGFTDVHRNKTVAVWLEDWYDKDTLKVYIDDEELQLTSALSAEEEAEYENKKIGTTNRRVATFVVPSDLKGNHKLRVEVEEEKLNIRFHSIDMTDENKEILRTYKLVSDDECNGVDFLTLTTDQRYSDYILKMPFSKLISNFDSNTNGIKYTTDDVIGKYNGYIIFAPCNEDGVIYGTESNVLDAPVVCNVKYFDKNKVGVQVSPSSSDDDLSTNDRLIIEFDRRDIDLTFDADVLRTADCYVSGKNADNSILSRDTINRDLEVNTGDVKVYLNKRDGVNFDNVEVYIYDTKMTVQEDNAGKYIVIPKNKYPAEYCEHLSTSYGSVHNYDWSYFDPWGYDIIIKGVQIDESKFVGCVGTINGKESATWINVRWSDSDVYYQDYNNKTYRANAGEATIIYEFTLYIDLSLKSLTIGEYSLDLSDMADYYEETLEEIFDTIYNDEALVKDSEMISKDYAIVNESNNNYIFIFQNPEHFNGSNIKQLKVHFGDNTDMTDPYNPIVTIEVSSIEVLLEVTSNIVADVTVEGVLNK